MRTVKIGIIGCGGIANWKHMPSLKLIENVEMVAFCDLIPERAEKAKSEYGTPDAKVFTDYRDLLKLEEIEVVHVLTPNAMHAKLTIAALNAGKHVMCEKPMAHTAKDARAMVKAAKDSGKKLTIGYQSRSNPVYQYAHNLVRSGELGDIYYVKAPAIRRRGVPTWGVFLDKEKQGGGPMIDIGTHSIDAALYVIGNYDVESVTGSVFNKLADNVRDNGDWGMWKPGEFKVEDCAIGYVKFKNGCTMIVEASWLLNIENGGVPTFCGTKGGIELRDGIRVNGERDGKLFAESHSPDFHDRDYFKDMDIIPEQYEARQWIQSIVEDTEPLVKPEEACVVSEIIEAIYKSAKTGKTVYFK
jgi:predicted dehydrogenase